jgi:RimJ/RimL family protein N-acetyltransferase
MSDLVTARLLLRPMTVSASERVVAGETGSVTIGFGLVPSARGQGYVSEALRGLLLFARARGVTSVKGDADHDNTASHHVMMAAGMRPAGEDERLRYFEIALTDTTAQPDQPS